VEPVEARKSGPFSLADFVSDVNGYILIYPMGRTPRSVPRKRDVGGTAYFDRPACLACQRRSDCTVKIKATLAKLTYRHKEVRLARRRAFQLTREYAERYRLRWRDRGHQ
jgi:hypothetical protein